MSGRFDPRDKWARKAQEEDFRARSVYKLAELDERFRLIKKGMTILDVGAAPGSWLQYCSEKCGPTGKVIGLDLQPIEPIADNVHTFVCDITDEAAIADCLAKVGVETVDLVLSDIAPKTSGIKDIDQYRSVELSQYVLDAAKTFLIPNGACAMKVFRGADFDPFLREVKEVFPIAKPVHVRATREGSKEVYVVGLKKGGKRRVKRPRSKRK